MDRSRTNLLPVALGGAVAVALVVSVVLAWTGVRDAASTATRGDAQRAVAEIRRAIIGLGHRPTVEELDRIRASFAIDGVSYVAILDPHGAVESGAAVLGLREPLPRAGEVQLDVFPVRAVAALHPRGDRPAPSPPPRHPPRLVIELAPTTARALEDRATATLAVGIFAALLLLAAALVLRRAARDREAALMEAAQARRLSSLGEMSAVLAHEIRNPLASLKGHAQLLEESLPEGSKERAKAERVVKEAVRIERLTTELLGFVRSGTVEPRDVDPREIARAAATDAGPDRIVIDDGAAPATARLDAERIRGALANLLRNALEASTGPVELRLDTDGGAVRFLVRDRGPGIAAGDEERIFEPFHTTRAQGTGLGLSIARRIAEAHGGTLHARSRPDGGGAELELRVPLAAEGR